MSADMRGGSPEFESDSPTFPTRRWQWEGEGGKRHRIPSTGQVTICRAGVPVDRMNIIKCNQCGMKIAIQRTCTEDLVEMLDGLGWGVWEEDPGEMVCPRCQIDEFNNRMDILRELDEEEDEENYG